MRIMGLVLLFVMTGCTVSPTMAELETQAFLTGDWSAVEKRERAIERRQQHRLAQCPAGMIAYCEVHTVGMECVCISQGSLQRALTWW